MARWILIAFLIIAGGCTGFTAGKLSTHRDTKEVDAPIRETCPEYDRRCFMRTLRAIDYLEKTMNRALAELDEKQERRLGATLSRLRVARLRLLTAVVFFDYAERQRPAQHKAQQKFLAPVFHEAQEALAGLCRHFSETAAGEQIITLFRLPCPGPAPVVGRN